MNSQTQQGAITQKISSVFTKSPRASTVSESPRQFDSKTVGTTVKDYSPGFTRLSRGPTALEVPRPLFSKTLGVLFLSAMLGLSLVLPEAHATGFKLRVTDLTAGTPAVIVTDNDVGVDLSGTVGKIISDLETTNFSVTTIGTSKPYIGSLPNTNRLDITSLIVTSTTAGDLLIEITDTGFSSASMATWGADFFTSIGGTLGIHSNTIQVESYWDANNEVFGVGTALSTLAFSGSYGFGGTDLFTTLPLPELGEPFSMTQRITISMMANDNMSYDSELIAQPVPEPGTMLLLGSGLLGLIGYRRKFCQP